MLINNSFLNSINRKRIKIISSAAFLIGTIRKKNIANNANTKHNEEWKNVFELECNLAFSSYIQMYSKFVKMFEKENSLLRI